MIEGEAYVRNSVLCFMSSHTASLKIEVRYTNWGTVCLEAVTLLPNRLFE